MQYNLEASNSLLVLLNLSDNYQNQSQFNTVVVQQIKVDRVGFEPTTSASFSSALYPRDLEGGREVISVPTSLSY
jgi:hypothetical protein